MSITASDLNQALEQAMCGKQDVSIVFSSGLIVDVWYENREVHIKNYDGSNGACIGTLLHFNIDNTIFVLFTKLDDDVFMSCYGYKCVERVHVGGRVIE